MSQNEDDWEVVEGDYRTPQTCPWCSGTIEEKLVEVYFLDEKVKISKFPKMVCSICGRSFLNDEQATYYEKLQDYLTQIYSVEPRKTQLQVAV